MLWTRPGPALILELHLSRTTLRTLAQTLWKPGFYKHFQRARTVQMFDLRLSVERIDRIRSTHFRCICRDASCCGRLPRRGSSAASTAACRLQVVEGGTHAGRNRTARELDRQDRRRSPNEG